MVHVIFLEHGVYFEESQSSIYDILLFLDFKCIKREPAYIDVLNQYLLEYEVNSVASTVPFKCTYFNFTKYYPIALFYIVYTL